MRIELRRINQIAIWGAFFFLAGVIFFLSWSHFRHPAKEKESSGLPMYSRRVIPPQKPESPPRLLEKHLKEPPFSDTSPAPEMVRKEIDAIAEGTRQKDTSQALQDLAESGKYLQKNVSSSSVDQISQMLQQSQKLSTRATEPEFLPPEGDFDFETAQVHDVERFRGEDGKYRYTILLFDAQGRTFRTEMVGADGEALWKTMQMIKKNPLMEKVYRTMVIPLLDEMIRKKKNDS